MCWDAKSRASDDFLHGLEHPGFLFGRPVLSFLDHLLGLRDPGVHVVPCEANIPVGTVDIVSAPNQHEVEARYAFVRDIHLSVQVNKHDTYFELTLGLRVWGSEKSSDFPKHYKPGIEIHGSSTATPSFVCESTQKQQHVKAQTSETQHTPS